MNGAFRINYFESDNRGLNSRLSVYLCLIRTTRLLCLLYIITNSLFINSCCSITENDFEFTKSELVYFSSFEKGDTLIFEDLRGNFDTIKIHDIKQEKQDKCGFLAPRQSNTIYVEIDHFKKDSWNAVTTTKYPNGEIKTEKTYQSLFRITKYPFESEIEFSISFRNFQSKYDTTLGKSQASLILNGFKWVNVYTILHAYPERIKDLLDIEIVYWSKKEGFIGYKNKEGIVWIRSPPPNDSPLTQ